MRESAVFWLDYLIPDEDGYLVSIPSYSPEIGGISTGATMDHEIAWDLFTNVLEAADALGIRDEFVEQVKAAREQLLPLKIGSWGQLQEWKEDVDDPSEFDITINLDPMSIPDACGLIHTTMELPQFQTTVESQKKLEDTIFAANVRAKIATEIEIIDDNIEVEAQDNVLIIKGTVHSIEEWDELKELLRQLPEVDDVESHLATPAETSAHH